MPVAAAGAALLDALLDDALDGPLDARAVLMPSAAATMRIAVRNRLSSLIRGLTDIRNPFPTVAVS
ncbi:hypothetical protein GCM10009839_25010 [Catenulispora yoronensis]|uniref:Uncharacterized protein n=1 Tax=Catenulispora yoronensis TaxID=450799 RepID=A0ABN2U1S4_9ACTN